MNTVTKLHQLLPENRHADIPQQEQTDRDSRQGKQVPMLGLCHKNGETDDLDYGLLSRIHFDGSGQLTLYFMEWIVTIEGKDLGKTRDQLRRRVKLNLVERDEAYESQDEEDTSYVTRIVVKTREAETAGKAG